MESPENRTTPFCFKLVLILLFLTPSGLGLINKDKGVVSGKKLFVFGDSYSDTGSWKKGTGTAWNSPYGSTFPGKPSGRFSDGRILTDFIASYMGIGSPVPYTQRRWCDAPRRLRFGINFAYGGSGVFDTDISGPNMTTQIDFFQNLLEVERAYTKHDLESSVALFTLGGNDYGHFIKSGSQEDLRSFIRSVVKQLASNLNRIHSLGVPKIAVTGLEPLGCLPVFSVLSSYLNCSDTFNAVAQSHNRVLKRAVEELNNQTTHQPPVLFLLLDLYGAFMSGLQRPKHLNGKLEYENPLKPCCQGVSNNYSCGSREGNEAKYTVCPIPEAAFFWDSVHPAQNGWYLVFLFIRSSLRRIR